MCCVRQSSQVTRSSDQVIIVMAMNLNEEDIYYILFYNIFCIVQYFKFDIILIPIKKQLVIYLITKDLFTINLLMACINRLNNKDKLLLLLADISPCKDSISKPDIYFYAKFTTKIVNNETIYFIVTISKEKELTTKLA